MKKINWLRLADNLHFELMQGISEGKNVNAFKDRIQSIQAMEDSNPKKQILAESLCDDIGTLPVQEGYKYIEPSDLVSIKSQRPASDMLGIHFLPDDERLYDKVYGAWLGRCAGCLLGKPIEGWKKERINGLLKETGNYPFKYYISSDISEEIKKKYGITDEEKADKNRLKSWINNVKHMPEDDDTNYTIVGLKILEVYGSGFTPDDVAECWLQNIPILHVCTAERIAYRNIVNNVYPPVSASYRNPFREWIGAQIRADFFGYVTPGNPELGAEFAWRDASISHVKNGVYGEMFVAAMLSEAAVNSDVEGIIRAGLLQFPDKSRLAEKVKDILSWKREGIKWEEAIDRIHVLYDESNEHDWCHTISNAMIVCIGLLYGEHDLEKSIGTAVLGGFDTDCNGATVGSIVGMIIGAKALPKKWIEPLNDQLKSGVDGFGIVRISEMASRTIQQIRNIR